MPKADVYELSLVLFTTFPGQEKIKSSHFSHGMILKSLRFSVVCNMQVGVHMFGEKSTHRLCPPKFQVSMVTETPVQGMHSSVIKALSPLVKHLCQVTG